MADPDPLDAEIAEFHRAARKRNVKILVIAGLFSILAGAVAVVIGLSASDGHSRYEAKALMLGAGLVIAGIGSLFSAFKISKGHHVD